MTAGHRLLLLPLLGLAACVPEGDFPSLAQRPGERNLSTEAPVRPRVDVPDDPALRARIASLRQQAAEGDRAFDAAFAPSRAAVNASGPRESETWVEAQQALSRLEAVRAPTTLALADLDRLALTRAATPTSEADFAEINAALAAVEQIAASQQARLDGLRAELGGS